MTIQGQRMISTTGIKCEGSSVLLQGVPYPQPYVIEAVGNTERLTGRSPTTTTCRTTATVRDPNIAVGWYLKSLTTSPRRRSTAC